MSVLYDTLAPVITAINTFITDLDIKFNYVRASIYDSGSATWIKKAGIPTTEGNDGDYCTDTVNNKVYKKIAGTWTLVTVGLTTKLLAIDSLTWAADKLILLTGVDTVSSLSISTFVQGILNSASADEFSNSFLPSQTGNNGKVLQTDGTNTSWQTISGTTSPLTTKGDLYVYSTTNARLAVGTNSQLLSADDTAPEGVKWIDAPTTSSSSGDVLGVQVFS